MKSVVRELFADVMETRPFNHKRDEHIEQVGKAMDAAYEKLRKRLNSKNFALFRKYVDLMSEYDADDDSYYFAEGFKLGVMIGIECAEV